MRILRFSGYAAIFDIEDLGGDTISPTAFDDALGGKLETKNTQISLYPIYWNHSSIECIGGVISINIDTWGLFVTGFIRPSYDNYINSIKRSEVVGLSFGYRTKKFSRLGKKKRILESIELFEVSIAPHPMHPSAFISSFEEVEVDDLDYTYQ
jgi:HK97 family phage prohead protease